MTAQYTSLAAPHKLEKRLLADGTYEALPTDNGPVEEEGLERQDKLTLEGFLPAVKAQERKSFGEFYGGSKDESEPDECGRRKRNARRVCR